MAGSRLPATFSLSYLVLPISADVSIETSIRWLNLPVDGALVVWLCAIFWNLDFNKVQSDLGSFYLNTKQFDSSGVIEHFSLSNSLFNSNCWWLMIKWWDDTFRGKSLLTEARRTKKNTSVCTNVPKLTFTVSDVDKKQTNMNFIVQITM